MVLDPDGMKARKILKILIGSDFSFSLHGLQLMFVRCSCQPLPLFIARQANNTEEERKSGPITLFRIVDIVERGNHEPAEGAKMKNKKLKVD